MKIFEEKKAAGEKLSGKAIIDLITVNGVRVVTEDGSWGLIRGLVQQAGARRRRRKPGFRGAPCGTCSLRWIRSCARSQRWVPITKRCRVVAGLS